VLKLRLESTGETGDGYVYRYFLAKKKKTPEKIGVGRVRFYYFIGENRLIQFMTIDKQAMWRDRHIPPRKYTGITYRAEQIP